MATWRAAFACANAIQLAFWCVGCTEVFDINADRYLAAEGVPSLPSNWACLNDPVPEPGADPVSVTFLFSDAATAQSGQTFSGTPIPDAQIRACPLSDIACDTYIAQGTSDAEGRVTITVPSGFNGYYEVRPPDEYLPSIIRRSTQLHSEFNAHPLIRRTILPLSAQLAGVELDPNLANAIFAVLDCHSVTAGGIRFTLAGQAEPTLLTYFRNRLVDTAATMTDETGSGLIFNLPPRPMSLTYSFADTNQEIGTASAYARAGWMTFLHARPEQAEPEKEPER